MSFVELETDSRASPGAVLAGRTATGRVSAQQSHPIWQTNRFRCSNPDPPGSQAGFGAVIVADRDSDSPFWPSGCRNGGARLLLPLFLQRNTQANPALAGVDGVPTAPKPVSLPMRLQKLHRNAFFCPVCLDCTETRLACRRGREPGRSSGAGPRDIAAPSLPLSALLPVPHAPALACSDFFDFPQICAMRPREAVFFWIKEGRQGDLRQRNAIDAGRPANVQR